MGGISIWQLVIILGIVLLLFGTKKLRNVGADLGGAIRGFKKAMREEEQAPAEKQLEEKNSTVIEGEATKEKEKA